MGTLAWWEVPARLGLALALGAGIGLERQWRSRMAGLRTNALVSTGAALFVLFSALTPGDNSPTRIASYVVSGVGFLGAGVIIRDRGNLRGINTAATVWGTAGVGVMAGGGHYPVAALGAVTIVLANVVLRPVAQRVDRREVQRDARPRSFRLRAVCRDAEEAHIRALVVQSVAAGGFALCALDSEDIGGTGRVAVTARLVGQDSGQLEQAVSRLSLEPGISSVSWRVGDDEEEP
ncbi:putative Mg2+ transporter-C (MgtC) family protein [Streptoalloteichus tenebrarius]|uniref:Mg2+ transporter-C (MgtC) family protein n=1 Tax=Streptoalloteichus tenebrarius (strain ATCC 17920 / DSM 40477 / JCM 4838 / CBS 697.72 / NBRC 16177 / NCIMB 11028 / NRRL B-12390 / A12253. 1 / ISP 5477) TaxID=1933 RepID=A0ABT1HVQ1_STRSD|nr:MgtC/SapB family protein [Streptoalloteichus tenebrarius]MCP2259583.1 putative Mg2+ transporter-C (MgtC) family protein [Streptoalloteichus tenebrarius]BFF01010.1 MgtC/SapB family protein [Streptoalloteichus tenebrarius]